jgi:glycosyltransferase involved in cell wall biosynthesis
MLALENHQWLLDFRRVHGRNPTVLHIGNIANNAYNNARLLNQAGLDCDVICYDYFHSMACPEWEDAEFQASFQDDSRPDWKLVTLNGFERPRWFAQGILNSCIRYLVAKRTNSAEAETLWLLLRAQSSLANDSVDGVSLRSLLTSKLAHLKSRLKRLVMVLFMGESEVAVRVVIGVLVAKLPKWFLLPALCAVLFPLVLLRVFGYPFRQLIGRQNAEADRQMSLIIRSWRNEFPDRVDHLRREDLLPYSGVLPEWKALMEHYDVVIGYSTDPLLPMLAGKPYFALEHGTIRDIPYAKSPVGRLCALSYRKALHVFVTNFDCVESAQTLAPGRFTVINHPYDEDHGLTIGGTSESRNDLLQELESSFLIFHPTRHDWVAGTGYADKSNDVLINAFIEMRRNGLGVGMVCCTWGKNVADTKALIADAGLSRHVKWVAPLPITPFERMCRSCDVVADQFKLGAFGGVCFKAMAVGAPILTYLNESLLLQQYPEVPPVINCEFSEDVVLRLTDLLTRPEEVSRMGQASREWMKKYHGKAATVNAQVDQFRQHLPVIS